MDINSELIFYNKERMMDESQQNEGHIERCNGVRNG